MRPLLLLLALSLFAITALAQSSDSLRFSGYFVNPGDTHGRYLTGSSDTAYGGGVEYFATKNVAVQLAVSSEFTVVTRFVTTFGPNGTVGSLPSTFFERVHPVDALVRYHFGSDSRWKPHVGAGARYIDVAGSSNWRPELNAGLTFGLTRHLGIDADFRQLFHGARQHAAAGIGGLIQVTDGAFDEGKNHRISLGLGWAF